MRIGSTWFLIKSTRVRPNLKQEGVTNMINNRFLSWCDPLHKTCQENGKTWRLSLPPRRYLSYMALHNTVIQSRSHPLHAWFNIFILEWKQDTHLQKSSQYKLLHSCSRWVQTATRGASVASGAAVSAKDSGVGVRTIKLYTTVAQGAQQQWH